MQKSLAVIAGWTEMSTFSHSRKDTQGEGTIFACIYPVEFVLYLPPSVAKVSLLRTLDLIVDKGFYSVCL